jgi:hypothetical protein
MINWSASYAFDGRTTKRQSGTAETGEPGGADTGASRATVIPPNRFSAFPDRLPNKRTTVRTGDRAISAGKLTSAKCQGQVGASPRSTETS